MSKMFFIFQVLMLLNYISLMYGQDRTRGVARGGIGPAEKASGPLIFSFLAIFWLLSDIEIDSLWL